VLYDALLRNLQNLSEATQSLPLERKSAFPGIPWREISGFRYILVHSYLARSIHRPWLMWSAGICFVGDERASDARRRRCEQRLTTSAYGRCQFAQWAIPV
jgi:hypothetical protein